MVENQHMSEAYKGKFTGIFSQAEAKEYLKDELTTITVMDPYYTAAGLYAHAATKAICLAVIKVKEAIAN